jgi:hypothetical protein
MAPQKRRRRSRRSIVFWIGVGVALFVAAAVVPVVPVASKGTPPAAAATTSNCPNGLSACVTKTIPPGCTPGAAGCATVVAGPTSGLGNGQYAFVQISNLKIGDQTTCNGSFITPCVDQAFLMICPMTNPLSSRPKCANGDSSQVLYAGLGPKELEADSSGGISTSVPTAFAPSGPGADPIHWGWYNQTFPGQPGGFFCDATHPCALEVLDTQDPFNSGSPLPPVTSADTAVFPLTFAGATSGCPAANPQIETDSSYSTEQFVPAAVESTCKGASGVTALNTASDTQSAVQAFASGATPLVFTDEPTAGFSTSALVRKSYKYVPVAVSSTVVAFQADDANSQSNNVPVGSYNLTPNMVAGLLTTGYQSSFGSDVLANDLIDPSTHQPYTCAQILECTGAPGSLNTFALLNPPTSYQSPASLFMTPSSVVTGSSQQVAKWICTQPNVPYPVNFFLRPPPPPKKKKHPPPPPPPTPVHEIVHDSQAGSSTLTSPISTWPPSAAWPYPNCQDYPGLPIIGTLAGVTPANQAAQVRKLAPTNSFPPAAGFATMDASQAAYYGLDVANLLSAAGSFVTPDRTSIDAALADASVQSNGVVTVNFNNTSDAAAYPLPMVTYALVSTAPQPVAQADAESNLLTSLINYSHSGGSVPLPAGYVPLPDNLYHAALADISSVQKSGTNAPGVKPSPGFVSGQSGAGGTNGGTSTGSGGIGANGVNNTTAGKGSANGSKDHGSHQGRPLTFGPSFEPVLVALITGMQRWLLPFLVLLAAAGILLGPALIVGVRLRRARLARRTP